MSLFLRISTAICLLLSAMLAGCSYGDKGHLHRNNTARAKSDPKIKDGASVAVHPKRIIQNNWAALQYSGMVLLPVGQLQLCEPSGLINSDILSGLNKKANRNAKNTTVSVRSRKSGGDSGTNLVSDSGAHSAVVTDHDSVQNGDGNRAGSPTQDRVVAASHEAASNSEPIAVVGNVAHDKVQNPSPLSDREDDMVDETKSLSASEMELIVGKYAGMISVAPGEMTNYPLYKFIDNWYGTEYKWGGTDNTGIDCSAFSQKLYQDVFGLDIMRTAREQRRSSEHIKDIDDAMQGDLIFFRVHHIRVSHVGVYLANGYFVHASSSQGVVISSLKSKYWRRRFAGCGRMEKDEPETESDSFQ